MTVFLAVVFAVTVLALAMTITRMARDHRRKMFEYEARIESLRGMCKEQERFINDAKPLHDAATHALSEVKDRLGAEQAEREAVRQTVTRLRSFLFEIIKRLPPDVADVATHNVGIMLARLPQVPAPSVPTDTTGTVN